MSCRWRDMTLSTTVSFPINPSPCTIWSRSRSVGSEKSGTRVVSLRRIFEFLLLMRFFLRLGDRAALGMEIGVRGWNSTDLGTFYAIWMISNSRLIHVLLASCLRRSCSCVMRVVQANWVQDDA